MRKRYLFFSIMTVLIAAVVGSLTAGALVWNLVKRPPVGVAYAQESGAIDTQTAKKINNLYINAINRVMPSVVRIDVLSVQKRQAPMNLWDFFFNEQPGGNGGPEREYKKAALGSGFVVEREGERLYILTNGHVVENATNISVEFQDGRRFEAKVAGIDNRKDLALVEVQVEKSDADLTPVVLGNSDKLQVGEWLIALGSPYGFDFSATGGIASAVKRVGGPHGNVSDFIQTDAAINQGNSGGPLINLFGEVVGINTWIASQNGGSVGLGFAVPINNIKLTLSELKVGHTPNYGWLGISVLDPKILSGIGGTEYLKSAGWSNHAKGAVVMHIFKNSPAERVGAVLPGDLILEVNGIKIDSGSHFVSVVGTLPANSIIKLKVIRNSQLCDVQIKLDVRKDEAVLNTETKDGWPAMTVLPLTEDLRQRLELKKGDQGVVIGDVIPKSLIATAGLRQGDLITAINGEKVTSIQTFYAVLNGIPARGSIKFDFIREGQRLNVGVTRR